MDLEARRLQLESAGLTVLQSAWSGPAPTPMEAWRVIIGGAAKPTARVRVQDDGRHLREVQEKWEEIAEISGLFGEHGEFLLSVAGVGSVAAPWAHVQRTPNMTLAEQLAPAKGEPEFVAMSEDGRVVCGITTEEYDVWIVAERLI